VQIAVIVNPTAGHGVAGRMWPQLQAAIAETFGPHESLFSDSRLHATRLASEALRGGAKTVYSVGGDGTHHEVVNGFFEAGRAINPNASLGLIPVGTGSDLARTLGIPRAPLEAVDMLRTAVGRPTDLIMCTCTDTEDRQVNRYVLNGIDCGFGPVVAAKVNRSAKLVGGFVPYLLASLSTLMRWHHVQVCMTLNDAHSATATVMDVAVANGRFTGGGMHVAPRASMSDGLMDVVAVAGIGKLRVLGYLPSLYSNRILDRRGVTWRQCRRIQIESDLDVQVAADGEPIGMLPATFEIVPAALKMLVPAHKPK